MENKSKKITNVPILRFDFNDQILPANLSSYLEVEPKRNSNGKYNKNDVLSVSGENGLVNQIEYLGRSYAGESVLPYHVVGLNQIVYTKSPLADNPYGIIKTNTYKEGIVSTLYAVYKAKENCNPMFVQHYFDYKPRVNKYLKPIVRIGAKHDMKIGNQEVLENIVYFPSLIEQNKIVEFLNKINKRLEVQNKIIRSLESQKKYLVKKIFMSIETNATIGDYLKEYSEKNTYNYEPVAVGKNGIRKRSDIFSRELSKDYIKNKVIKLNSLIIGMGTKQIDLAILHQNEKYCVSPAYSTFVVHDIDPFYFDYLLKSMNYLLSLRYMISGARQGKSVNKKELLKHKIFVHSKNDQTKISLLLQLIDNRINVENKILDNYYKQKSFLLNNLFI